MSFLRTKLNLTSSPRAPGDSQNSYTTTKNRAAQISDHAAGFPTAEKRTAATAIYGKAPIVEPADVKNLELTLLLPGFE